MPLFLAVLYVEPCEVYGSIDPVLLLQVLFFLGVESTACVAMS